MHLIALHVENSFANYSFFDPSVVVYFEQDQARKTAMSAGVEKVSRHKE